MMLRAVIYTLFLLLLGGQTFAAKDSVEVRLDDSRLILRNFSESALKEYSEDSDFKYDESDVSVNPSWWERLVRWFFGLFRNVYSEAATGGNAKYLFIVLGTIAIIFAVVKLSGMDPSMVFTGKSKSSKLEYTESIEDLHAISFDQEIENAVGMKDYRLAVRLLYLKTLKKLSDAGKIKWEPDKTNSRYISELRNPEQKEQFKKLTFQFEYVWYGGFGLDASSFAGIRDSFRNFNGNK